MNVGMTGGVGMGKAWCGYDWGYECGYDWGCGYGYDWVLVWV